MKKAYKYVYNGEKHNSIASMAKKYGLNPMAMHKAISRGETYTEYLDKVLGARVEYKGVEYKNLRTLLNEVGGSVPKIERYMGEGRTLEDSVDKYLDEAEHGKRMFKGKRYKGFEDMANDFGYTYEIVRGYIVNRGLKVGTKHALEQMVAEGYVARGVEYKGARYSTYRELIESKGLVYENVYSFISKRGIGVLEYLNGLESGKYKSRTHQYKGKVYTSMRSLLVELGYEKMYDSISRAVLKEGITLVEYLEGVEERRYSLPTICKSKTKVR